MGPELEATLRRAALGAADLIALGENYSVSRNTTVIQDISVIGSGKLGAGMLRGHGSRGFDVIGVDMTESSIRAVRRRARSFKNRPGGDDLCAS